MKKHTKTKIGVGSVIKAKVRELENITREGRQRRMRKEVVVCVQSVLGKKKFCENSTVSCANTFKIYIINNMNEIIFPFGRSRLNHTDPSVRLAIVRSNIVRFRMTTLIVGENVYIRFVFMCTYVL